MIKGLLKRAKKNPHIEIQQCDRLHAKVIVGEANLVVGSANLSRNGLGLEGQELAHWLEAGIHTTTTDEVRAAQQWFEQLWRSAETRVITDDDLKAAIVAYNRNRNARPDYSPKGPFTFAKYLPHELEVRDAYALIYNSRPCEEADEARDRYHQQIVAEQGGEKGRRASKHWNFESWPNTLDTTGKYEYLCLFLENDGELVVDGVCRMTGLRIPFQYISVSDLRALTLMELRKVAAEIQSSPLNIWSLYWNEDAPTPENDCRDILADKLRDRLRVYGDFEVSPEVASAGGTRADMVVTHGTLSLPFEAKRSGHSHLWYGHSGQLQTYTQAPSTEGQGIYIVFWFGKGLKIPASPEGTTPDTPNALKVAPEGQLPAELRAITSVVVLDLTDAGAAAKVRKESGYEEGKAAKRESRASRRVKK